MARYYAIRLVPRGFTEEPRNTGARGMKMNGTDGGAES